MSSDIFIALNAFRMKNRKEKEIFIEKLDASAIYGRDAEGLIEKYLTRASECNETRLAR